MTQPAFTTRPAGPVEVTVFVDGVGYVRERVYPLCGMAIETEVYSGKADCTIRPDTYCQRAVITNYAHEPEA
jgi:hypothetical protein